VLALLPSTPKEASWLTDEEKAAIAARLAAEDSSRHQRFWPALRDARVWALGFVYLGYSISYYGVQLWLPQIVQAMGFSNLATSFLVALPFAATMVAMTFWGRSSDASGERIWHVAIPALVAMTSLLVASATGSNLVVFLALSFAVMSLMSLQGPYWSLPQSYLSGVAAAGGIAFINTIGTGAGGFIGPYVVGILKDATGGYSVPMAVLAAAPAMTAIVVLSLKNSVAPQTVIAS
jgi:ACS family tartrate transporter-like MFS transporter